MLSSSCMCFVESGFKSVFVCVCVCVGVELNDHLCLVSFNLHQPTDRTRQTEILLHDAVKMHVCFVEMVCLCWCVVCVCVRAYMSLFLPCKIEFAYFARARVCGISLRLNVLFNSSS